MADTTIWEEISKIDNIRRRTYFQWKNGIQGIKKDYSKMTEDDYIEYCSRGWAGGKISNREQFLNYMKRWESSAEYKRLLFLLKEDEFATDMLEVYEEVKKKAIEDTDSQAIKNMIMLQKEIKKYRKSIDKYMQTEEKEEDDGLIL